ncbi:MAG TPA: UvrD-helicase domain-containing protein, partial [Beutenbergiaceae bacterium]|nr:UvrD-helicase domain-containing protein [Beutenbergiaceae bacterium]
MPITAFAAPHHARWPTDGGNHLIVGPPQSGKTTAAINAFVDYVSRHGPHRAVFLTPTRQQAARLRSVITNKFGGTTGHMLVRTPASLAFGVLRDAAVQQGKPSPTLITGPEQDHILSELIAGHLQDGVGPQWPSDITPDVLSMRAFRDELRDLLMRAAEAGLDGEQLTRLGNQQNRPEWVAAGEILTEYTLVTLLGQATPDRGARYDAATIVDQAVAHLHAHPDAAAFDVVVHDDYQDATLATSRLLTVLDHQGAQVLLASNPDTGVQGFRGGLPALTRTATLPLGSQEGALGAQAHVLSTVWMGPGVWNRVEPLTSDLPPLVGAARRHVTTVQGPTRWVEPVETVMLGSPHSEAAFIAHRLRQLHLVEGWAWSDMAVIVRSHHHAIRLRRALVNAQVPIEMEGVDLPLRDQAVVRAMLTCVEAATQGDGPTPEQVTEVLMSRFGLIDAITLRRIRRALRHHDPSRSSAEMLVGAIKDPELRAVAGDHPGFDRVAAMFRQARQAV